jgi:hypothetical protein
MNGALIRIWKQTVMGYSKILPSIQLEELRKIRMKLNSIVYV